MEMHEEGFAQNLEQTPLHILEHGRRPREPVLQLAQSLCLDRIRDVVLHELIGSHQCGHVVSVASWQEVRDQIDRHHEVG